MAKKNNVYTTGFGSPVDNDQNSKTAGSPGPLLLQDVHLLEKLGHFNRERIPERVVHAKGAGAHGYFEVSADVTKYTKARFLSEIGKRTDVFVRFSTVGGEKGSADAECDPRGFAVKFYTEDGNYDMVGNNTPVFFIRDPLRFPGLAARHPYTHPNDDFFQTGELYRRVMTHEDRDNLIGNITTHLCNAQKRIQLRQTALFYKADPESGRGVAEGLGLDIKEVERLAKMSQEYRAKATAQ